MPSFLEKTIDILKDNGFLVLRPERFPPNDESLSLGQIAYGLNIDNKIVYV